MLLLCMAASLDVRGKSASLSPPRCEERLDKRRKLEGLRTTARFLWRDACAPGGGYAVGVPRDAERLANEIGGVEAEASDSSARASSFDVSALAEALSPAKSESASAQSDPGSPRGDDARPVSEIAAAAAGLRRMYAALGGEANDAEAAFYERFARARDENLISSI